MTNILLLKIRTDFPKFNENELYNPVKRYLSIIFLSITDKDKTKLHYVALLYDMISKHIDILINSNMQEEYSDINFYK